MNIRTSDDVDEDTIRGMKFIGSDGFWDCYLDDDGRMWSLHTQQAKKQVLEAKISFAKVPFAYSLTKLENIDPEYYSTNVTRQLMIIQDYISGFGRHLKNGESLYIWSHMLGSGKTMTACAISNELIERGYNVLFMTSGQMFAKIRDTFNDKSKYSSEQIIKSIEDCDLLVLDDLGSENMTPWTDETMFEVVNARYLSHKPILFTSNSDVKELRYNRRIIDRINADCNIVHWPEEGVRNTIADMKKQGYDQEYEQTSFGETK